MRPSNDLSPELGMSLVAGIAVGVLFGLEILNRVGLNVAIVLCSGLIARRVMLKVLSSDAQQPGGRDTA